MIDTEGFVEPTVKLGSLYVAVTVGISIRLYPEFVSTIILLVKLYYPLDGDIEPYAFSFTCLTQY